MHIPDGWVNLPTSAAAAAVAAASVAVAGRRTAARLKERATTLPAVLTAYLLVAQLPALPLGVGTSAHLVGTGLVTALVGPSIAIVCVATVVVVQALVLADGGVTAIGLNLLANGPVPALVAAGVLAIGSRSRGWPGSSRSAGPLGPGASRSAGPLGPGVSRSEGPLGPKRMPVVAGLAAALGTMAAAATTAAELAIGGTDVIPQGTVAAVIGGAHFFVAVGEGLLTAAVVGVIVRLRPDLVGGARTRRPRALAESSPQSEAPAGEGAR